MHKIGRAIAVVCFAAIAAAQQDPAAPTFSAATRLVQVDVVARSKGAPATGLTKEDFTLFDNGKPQQIAFFSVRSARTAVSPSVPLLAGAVSNRPERGSEASTNATILLVDEKNTPREVQAFAIQRIVKFVQMRRGGDRIGIYVLGGAGLYVVQELTDDAGLLSRAANSLKARDPRSRSSDTTGMSAHAANDYAALTLVERATDFKQVLQAIAQHLARAPGRKSLIWVTTSFPLISWALGLDFTEDMEAAARALNDANVALYAVDAHGLIGALSGLTAISNAESGGPRSPAQLRMQMGRGEPPNPPGLDTMNLLARLTGGLVFYNKSNAIEESIQAAVDDGELTCTLGFYPTDGAQDGTWHNLKVKVARRAVSVRYRQNYFAAKPLAVANGSPTLEELLKGSLDATGLALVAEATPDSARPGYARVRVSIDLHDVQLERHEDTWVGTIDVSFFVEGSQSARTFPVKVEIPDGQLASSLEKGISVIDSIPLNDRAGTVRIVARDRATGAAGSVRVPLGTR